MQSDRANILAFAQFVVRDLLRAFQKQHVITVDETQPLKMSSSIAKDDVLTQAACRLLIVTENFLCHGLRTDSFSIDPIATVADKGIGKDMLRNTTTILRRARDQILNSANSLVKFSGEPNPWPVLLFLEQLSPELEPLSKSVTMMTEVHSGLGRSRLWLRWALMRKNINDYFRPVIEHRITDPPPVVEVNINSPERDIRSLAHYYYPDAMMLNNEGLVFIGLLESLKLIDFCFVVKHNLDRFDDPLHVVPYYIYLQSNLDKFGQVISKDNSEPSVGCVTLFDQKNFLEDLCSRLQKRDRNITETNKQLELEINHLTEVIESLKLENRSLNIVNDFLKNDEQSNSTADSAVLTTNEFTTMNELNIGILTHRLSEFENEMRRVHNTAEEKTELVESLKSRLCEANKRVQQLTRHLTDSRMALDQKQNLIRQLEAKSKGMTVIVDQMTERITKFTDEKIENERKISYLNEQLSDFSKQCEVQTSQIQRQRSIIENLELTVTQQNAELLQLRTVEKQLAASQSKIASLEAKNAHLSDLCEGQEHSLTEMALIVNSSKLEAESLKEAHDALKQAQWANDSEVPNCSLCHTNFTISRRRHHCRNCGSIFCHDCSSQMLSLPSSAKPVRVCNPCHTLLLNRYSAK